MVLGDLIPGETPLEDISGLKVSVTTRTELNEYEAENVRKATVKYLGGGRPSKRLAKFNLTWACQLHDEMFGDVWSWAGYRRSHETNIGVPPLQIEMQLHNLMEDLPCWEKSGMDFFEQAARLHHQAVMIHPFANGNGRWARLLTNIRLKQMGKAIICWPEVVIGTTSPIRDEYLQAIRAADQGSLTPLLELHRRFAEPSA